MDCLIHLQPAPRTTLAACHAWSAMHISPVCCTTSRSGGHSIPNRRQQPSLNGLWAALLGGLGVTVRTAFNLPEGLVSAGSLYGLPPLGSLPVTLHRSAN